jgi:hypothetical protein
MRQRGRKSSGRKLGSLSWTQNGSEAEKVVLIIQLLSKQDSIDYLGGSS